MLIDLTKEMIMKTNLIFAAVITALLAACSTSASFKPVEESSKFYADKLSCENLYTQGFNIWGNKVYGDINTVGAARDCMLSKGYQVESK